MKKFMSKHFNITFFIVLALGQLVAQTEFGSKLLKENIKTKIDSLKYLDLINEKYGNLTIAPSNIMNRSTMPDVIAPAWKPSGHRQTI